MLQTFRWCSVDWNILLRMQTHTHTHTHAHVCVCVCDNLWWSFTLSHYSTQYQREAFLYVKIISKLKLQWNSKMSTESNIKKQILKYKYMNRNLQFHAFTNARRKGKLIHLIYLNSQMKSFPYYLRAMKNEIFNL